MLAVVGSDKSNMAATKPEVLISQNLQDIETRFQRLPLQFMGPTSPWSYGEQCGMRPEASNKYFRLGGRYIGIMASGYIPHSSG
jgi:hypothetical protein